MSFLFSSINIWLQTVCLPCPKHSRLSYDSAYLAASAGFQSLLQTHFSFGIRRKDKGLLSSPTGLLGQPNLEALTGDRYLMICSELKKHQSSCSSSRISR